MSINSNNTNLYPIFDFGTTSSDPTTSRGRSATEDTGSIIESETIFDQETYVAGDPSYSVPTGLQTYPRSIGGAPINYLMPPPILSDVDTSESVTPSGITPPSNSLDKELFEVQKQWWNAKVNLESTEKFEKQATDLRSRGAKDTSASDELAKYNNQVYYAMIDKYNAIVNLDANAYQTALNAIRDGRAKGSTLTSDNTGLDSANLQILSYKKQYWDLVLTGQDTSTVVKNSLDLRKKGATITDASTKLDEANAIIASAKLQYYQAWSDLDSVGQANASSIMTSQYNKSTFSKSLGMIDNSSALDTLNQQMIAAKTNYWQAKVDSLDEQDYSASTRMIDAKKMENDAKMKGATLSFDTKFDSINKSVYDQISSFKNSIRSSDYDTAARKLMDYVNSNNSGATVKLKLQSYMTSTSINKVLVGVQAQWWSGKANEDLIKMDLAANTGTYLRNVLKAQDTAEGSNMAQQNSAYLTARKNYWTAYANLDDVGIQNAMKQQTAAINGGATLWRESELQIDRDNKQIILDKVKHWIVKGDQSMELPYENDANGIRDHAAQMGVGEYVLPNVLTKLDDVMSNWYTAKRDRWLAEANDTDQSNAISRGLAAFQQLADFDKTHSSIFQDALKGNTKLPLDDNNVTAFVIDSRNRAVLNNRSQIQAYVQTGNYDAAQSLFNTTKELLNKGATLDIGIYVTITRPSTNPGTDAILEKIKELLFSNEGAEDTVNPNDNGALSIGRFQWHAGRAKELLKNIAEQNQTQAKQLLGTSLFNEVYSSVSWESRTVNSAEASAIQSLLRTSQSHQSQVSLANADATKYITEAKDQGLTDPKAIVYFADLYNQGPVVTQRIMKTFSNRASVTLDDLHRASMNDPEMGQYVNRRTNTYNTLKNWNIGATPAPTPNPTPTPIPSQPIPITAEGKRQAIIELGKTLMGKVTYLESPESKIVNLHDGIPATMDCSSFVGSVFLTALDAHFPRTTYGQVSLGKAVAVTDLRVGDLVFFNGDSHVGIYEGGNMILHCGEATSKTSGTVKETPMDYLGSISHIRRIIADDGSMMTNSGSGSSEQLNHGPSMGVDPILGNGNYGNS